MNEADFARGPRLGLHGLRYVPVNIKHRQRLAP
jgi:hypothetical protein